MTHPSGGPVDGHGMAVWSSPEWLAGAVSWLDERLADAGIERRGDVEQPHVRPWATLLRAPTSTGAVWLKAAGPGTAHEIGLYQLVARVVPDRVLTPIAADPGRGWIVLPDGGSSLGERLTGADLGLALAAALVDYGRLQLELAPHVDELLSLGVADMRPHVMLERFDEALEVTDPSTDPSTDDGTDPSTDDGTNGDADDADPSTDDGTGNGGDADDAAAAVHRRVAAMRNTFASWCEELSASALSPSLDHNDLHAWNILGDAPDDLRFYDWGDSVVAHPFAAMLVPLGEILEHLEVGLDDPRYLRARDAYLEVFTDLAPGEDLVATLEVACRVAKAARVHTWERGLRAARQQSDQIDPRWAAAAMATLASLLDESYLGGA